MSGERTNQHGVADRTHSVRTGAGGGREPVPCARTRKLPPGPRWQPLRVLREVRRDFLGFVQNMTRTYGDVVYCSVGPIKIAILGCPEVIQDVLTDPSPTLEKGLPLDVARELLGAGLLTTEGDTHRRQRKLTQPFFRPERVQAYGEAMVDETLAWCERLRDGAVVDVAREMSDLAVTIAARTMLGRRIDPGVAAALSLALDNAMRLYTPATVPYARFKLRLPLPSSYRFRRSRAYIHGFVADVVREHREHPDRFDDLICGLLRAHDEDGDDRATADGRTREEAATMLLASFETTSRALAWSWYLLSEHADVEARLHEEVDTLLAGRSLSVADARNLRYTRSVFAESLRLYPPVYAIARQTFRDMDVGGYRIPAKTLLLMCPYTVQRDERYFHEPARFDPDRWMAEGSSPCPAFAYFPFGGGSRRCIGEAVAWNEGVLVIAAIAQHWRLHLVQGHPVEPQLLIHMQPRHGLPMTAKRRPGTR